MISASFSQVFSISFTGLLVGGVKYRHAAGKNVRHGLYQRLHLLLQEVIEHAGRKEHSAACGVDGIKPRGIIQVAGNILLPVPGREQLIAYRNHIRKIQIVDKGFYVITYFLRPLCKALLQETAFELAIVNQG